MENGPMAILRVEEKRAGWNRHLASGVNRRLQALVQVGYRVGGVRLSFVALVLLPTLISAFYLSFLASNEYVSEARLVVRSPSDDSVRKLTSELSSLAAVLSGPRSSQQDTHIVVGYLQGRSVIDDLGGKEVVEGLYSRKDIDWFSRLRRHSSFEKVWKYWRRKVNAVIDVPSGIVTVNVRGFSQQDTYDLSTRLVVLSERLVNEISERARADTLSYAEAELKKARQQVDEKRETLLEFRNSQEILDPMMSASSIGKTISELIRERLKIENQIAILQGAVAPSASVVLTLRAEKANIEKQIRELDGQLASDAPSRKVLATQLATYEHLQLELKFAEKLYEIAESAFKKAQIDAQKQQLYLVPIVRPSMPEEATYPRPALDTLLVFVWLSVLWSVATLTVASIKDHR